MASLNQCNFIGRVGRDPEIRYSQDGKSIANFSIAVSEKYKDKETTEWVRVVAFSKLAEIVEKYVVKGRQVFVSGRMQTRSWEKDNITRYTTEIVAANMQMLDGKGQASGPRGDDQVGGDMEGREDSDIPF
jgi:single-strand DNA-binding protein